MGDELVHDRWSQCAPDAVPLVLVHGLGVSGRYLLPVAERLAEHRNVLVPDLPGSGRSSTPREPLGVVGLARALEAWTTEVGLRRAWFLGHSLGAQVVVELARAAPDLVAGLVLASATPDRGSRSSLRLAARLAVDMTREPPALWWIAGTDYLRYGPLRIVRTLRDLVADPVERKLPLPGIPVVVVRGVRDPICTATWAHELAARSGGTMIEVAGAHAAQMRDPDGFAAAVERAIRVGGASLSAPGID